MTPRDQFLSKTPPALVALEVAREREREHARRLELARDAAPALLAPEPWPAVGQVNLYAQLKAAVQQAKGGEGSNERGCGFWRQNFQRRIGHV